ncbi:MAG: Uma2 family endonuclease [Spirulina sp. SIO3F2]|nr:Uma2 family endonuclease [Spirulina sp. SIO3F2]
MSPTTPTSSPILITPKTYATSNAAPEFELDISHLVLEDESPVDNLIQEKLQRLLVHCLYNAFLPGQPFVAMADVGLFYGIHLPPLVPDVMLSLGVQIAEDWSQKQHRSYLMWEFGKSPEVVIEIVSNRKGHELDTKLTDYAQIGIEYYVVFDPLEWLSEQPLQVYGLKEGQYEQFTEAWLPKVGLGLTLWSGTFESKQYDRWLRWCDRNGNLLLTGHEQATQELQRAEEADQRAAQEAQRAEEADQRAVQEAQRAEKAEQRLAALLAQLQAQGIDLDDLNNNNV